MSVVLLASYAQVGEYLILDGVTRTIVFGPFESNPNALLVEAQLRRQMKGREEVRFEWVTQLAPEASRRVTVRSSL